MAEHVPILPPEESQRMGYPVIAALEARVADCKARERWEPWVLRTTWADRRGAYEDALELVRAAHRGYGGD